jgi:hypothetical protein
VFLQSVGLHTNGLNEYVTPLRAQRMPSLKSPAAAGSAAAVLPQPGLSLPPTSSCSLQSTAQGRHNEELSLSTGGKPSMESPALHLRFNSVGSFKGTALAAAGTHLGSSIVSAVVPQQVEAMVLDSTQVGTQSVDPHATYAHSA